jgi:hypothetical protein
MNLYFFGRASYFPRKNPDAPTDAFKRPLFQTTEDYLSCRNLGLLQSVALMLPGSFPECAMEMAGVAA